MQYVFGAKKKTLDSFVVCGEKHSKSGKHCASVNLEKIEIKTKRRLDDYLCGI